MTTWQCAGCKKVWQAEEPPAECACGCRIVNEMSVFRADMNALCHTHENCAVSGRGDGLGGGRTFELAGRDDASRPELLSGCARLVALSLGLSALSYAIHSGAFYMLRTWCLPMSLNIWFSRLTEHIPLIVFFFFLVRECRRLRDEQRQNLGLDDHRYGSSENCIFSQIIKIGTMIIITQILDLFVVLPNNVVMHTLWVLAGRLIEHGRGELVDFFFWATKVVASGFLVVFFVKLLQEQTWKCFTRAILKSDKVFSGIHIIILIVITSLIFATLIGIVADVGARSSFLQIYESARIIMGSFDTLYSVPMMVFFWSISRNGR